MKVVVDTNVIASALLSSYGKPAVILNMFFDEEIQIYYSDTIFLEYKDVLSRPALNINLEKATRFLDILKNTGISIKPTISDIPFQDEDDRIFYDTARQSDAILITGNSKHYPVENFIMTPSEFLNV